MVSTAGDVARPADKLTATEIEGLSSLGHQQVILICELLGSANHHEMEPNF
jgi:hypothetical protein